MEELLAIFCDVDDFCRDYEEYCQHHLLMDKSQIIPKTSMSLSEIMTIVIYFHLSNQRTFKWYYIKFVGTVLRPYFPKQVSYNRFVEIMKMSIVPLTLYLMKYRVGKCTGINFMDSTTLDVCYIHTGYLLKRFLTFLLSVAKLLWVGFTVLNFILSSTIWEKFCLYALLPAMSMTGIGK